jgi:hypothetical protein
MQNIALSKAGALYIHTSTSQVAASSWEITTDSDCSLSTKMIVRALDANKITISYYIVEISAYESFTGAYQLFITDSSEKIHKIIVLIQSNTN